jgi:hypothetical protein
MGVVEKEGLLILFIIFLYSARGKGRN